MNRTELRAAVETDRDAMLDLWVEAWSDAMPHIDFENRRTWFAARIEALEAAGAHTTVAVDPVGTLAGFLTLNRAERYLDQLAVRPLHQGRGLARRMVAEAKRLCPAGLDLHVNQDNDRALRFYEHEGFARRSPGINTRSGLPIWHMHWPGTGADG